MLDRKAHYGVELLLLVMLQLFRAQPLVFQQGLQKAITQRPGLPMGEVFKMSDHPCSTRSQHCRSSR